MSITKEQITAVKGRGFLLNRGTENFSGRVVSVAGQFTADQLIALADCARQFGEGKVIFTARLTAEIPGIPYEKIPQAEEFMAGQGMLFGGTGAKIRPIVACKGTTCVYGNIDTQALAARLHEEFYLGRRDLKLPHKFKIGIGGCPNSCMKPSLNDVGIEGGKIIAFDAEKCRGCKVCAVANACPSHAVTVSDGLAHIDPDRCLECGVCIGKCPFGALPRQAESFCRIYVGGTWGKTQRPGTPLSGRYSPDEIPAVIDKILTWYQENGQPKERLGAAIDRLGLESLENALQ